MLQYIDLTKCASKVRRFSQGSIITQANGSSAAEMYILLKGSAAAYTNTHNTAEKHFTAYKAGDFFGEMALFLGQGSAIRVIASEEVLALVIDREYLATFFAEQPQFAMAFAEELCRRLQHKPAEAPKISALSPEPITAKPIAEAPVLAVKPDTPSQQAAKANMPACAVSSTLFPEGHMHQELPIASADSEYLFIKSYSCPICDYNFKTLAVKTSKLIPEKTDSDLRVHYLEVEPLHYDIISCPNCWYSAMTETFKDGVSSKTQIEQLMKNYKNQLTLHFDENRNSLNVFAGYYLAIACAPKCFRNYDAIVGKLWLKLGRLYDDCHNEEMALYAVEQALNGYMGAYEKSTIPEKQNQQLYYIIGELNLRVNNLSNARKFFFQAKTEKNGSPVLARQAEDRIEYLRKISSIKLI